MDALQAATEQRTKLLKGTMTVPADPRQLAHSHTVQVPALMKDEEPMHHQAMEASDGQPLFKGNCDHRHLLSGPAKAGP